MKNKSIMLIVPNMRQGGQQKICLITADILRQETAYDVCIVVFDGEKAFYDTHGQNLIDIHLPAEEGVAKKFFQVLRRIAEVKKIKKDRSVDYAYSFGMTANIVNVFSKEKEKTLAGVRGYLALKNRLHCKFIYPRADITVCCSKSMAEDARKVYGIKNSIALTNPLPIDSIRNKAEEETASLQKADEKVIITAGRVNEVKGYWHLIKAFALVKKTYKNVRLVHIGDGNPASYIELARDLGIEECVEFLGAKSNPFPYIADADMYILSSISEGFPNAMLEAMALGIPVVAADCRSGPREILHKDMHDEVLDRQGIVYADYGVLVPAMCADANWDAGVLEKEERYLAEAMLHMLSDEELRIHYRKKAKERAENFSIEKYRKELNEIMCS